MSVLVWLSGAHLSSAEPRDPNINQESIEDSTLLELVRGAKQTKQILNGLINSKNVWIREYAALAVNAGKMD